MAFPSPGADWPLIDAYLRSLGVRIDDPLRSPLGYGETEGGNHVMGSEHYQHRARDYGINQCDAPAVAKALAPLAHGRGYVIDELFFSPLQIWFADGVAFVPGPRAIERINHFSHCHGGCIWNPVFPGVRPPPPTPKPAPPPPPQEDDVPLHVAHSPEDTTGARWLTDGLTRRWLTRDDFNYWLLAVPNHKDEEWPIAVLGRIPTVGPTP